MAPKGTLQEMKYQTQALLEILRDGPQSLEGLLPEMATHGIDQERTVATIEHAVRGGLVEGSGDNETIRLTDGGERLGSRELTKTRGGTVATQRTLATADEEGSGELDIQAIPDRLLVVLQRHLMLNNSFQLVNVAPAAGMDETYVEPLLERLHAAALLDYDPESYMWRFTEQGREALRWRPQGTRPRPAVGGPRRYQVFLSSTYEDLKTEREFLTWELLKGHRFFPTGMETLPSSPDRGWKIIKATMDASDYFVLIVAGRYGSTDHDGKSWTEREYDYAIRHGIPVFVFIRDHGTILVDDTDKDTDLAAKLEAFKTRLRDAHKGDAKPWKTKEELALQVLPALNREVEHGDPRPGWYRGDQVPDVRDLQQKLDAEQGRVRKLEQQLGNQASHENKLKARIADLERKLERAGHHADGRKVRTLAPNTNSGNLGTGEVVYEIVEPITGWQVSNLGKRTVTVNGVAVEPGALPPARGEKYRFVFSAGEPTFTSWSYWAEASKIKQMGDAAGGFRSTAASPPDKAAASLAIEDASQGEDDQDIDTNNASRLATVSKLERYFEDLLKKSGPGQLLRLAHDDIAKAAGCSKDDVWAWLPELYRDLQKSGWKDLKPGNAWLEIRTPGQPGFEKAHTLAPNAISGPLGAGERLFVVEAPITWWQAEYCDGRSIEVNGVVVAPGQELPPPDGAKYYFRFSAGGMAHAQWSYRQ